MNVIKMEIFDQEYSRLWTSDNDPAENGKLNLNETLAVIFDIPTESTYCDPVDRFLHATPWDCDPHRIVYRVRHRQTLRILGYTVLYPRTNI